MGLARPRLVVLLTCLAAIALAGAPAEALAAKKPTAKSTLAALVKQTNRLPAGAASAAKRRALKRLARHARRVARRRPCASVRDLARFRRVLGRVKVKKNKRSRAARRLTALGPASLDASRLLLAGKKTRRCGGGVKPGTRANPRFRIVGSNARRLRVRVQLPQLHFVARQARGKAWTELKLSKSDAPGDPGAPGHPVRQRLPRGARRSEGEPQDERRRQARDRRRRRVPGPEGSRGPGHREAELQRRPFADAPFTINRKAYATDKPIPAKPADADILGRCVTSSSAACRSRRPSTTRPPRS